MHSLKILRPGLGHQTVTWEPKTETEDKAREVFDQMMAEGRAAFVHDPVTKEDTEIKTFKPEAAEIIMIAPIIGGVDVLEAPEAATVAAPVLPNEMDVLCKAADILERDGWVQHKLHTENGHCAVGALEWAAVELFGDLHYGNSALPMVTSIQARLLAQKRLLSVVNFRFGSTWDSVENWNDANTRTKETVVQTMRLAGDCAN